MKFSIARVSLALFLSLSLQSTFIRTAKADDWETKRQEHLAQAKSIKTEGIKARMAILQDALSCVQAAQSRDALEECQHKEHVAHEALMKQQKEKWEAMKAQRQDHKGPEKK